MGSGASKGIPESQNPRRASLRARNQAQALRRPHTKDFGSRVKGLGISGSGFGFLGFGFRDQGT